MFIKQLTFFDKAAGWQLEPTTFDKFNLLVGASGVGKTRILDSIMKLKDIANGKSFNGIQWEILFSTLEGAEYEWSGEFEYRNSSPQKIIPLFEKELGLGDEIKFSLLWEKVICNGSTIAERKQGEIFFGGLKIPKLSGQKSLMHLLGEKAEIFPANKGFQRIILCEKIPPGDMGGCRFVPNNSTLDPPELESIRNSDENIITKLFYAQNLEIFQEICERFSEMFPQVESIKLTKGISNLMIPMGQIQIKEKDVSCWIPQNKISAGMFRTLIRLSEIYLCREDSVFLIDEFENSLGINCMVELTQEFLSSTRNIQFILSSHHPYIINNIGFQYWKIVTRKGGIIKTRSAAEYNLGRSKHDAFMQLIQLDAFKTGDEKWQNQPT